MESIHDLHIWPLTTSEAALTAHLVRAEGGDDAFLAATCDALARRFGLIHATLQVERQDLAHCDELHP